MIDRILEVGSAFDYISPIAAMIGDIANGPAHTFLIPIDSSPCTGRETATLLRRRGVQSWGLMIVSGTLMVSVRQSQARYAQHLLDQAGIPTEGSQTAATDKRKPAHPMHGRSRLWRLLEGR
jgi:hypothetical protein